MEVQEFYWKAADTQGRITAGTWRGTGLPEIQRRLFREGYYPIEIRSSRRIPAILSAYFHRLASHQSVLPFWVNLTHQLALILQAGIPILSAFELLAVQDQGTKRRGSRTNWLEIKGYLEAGLELSEALESVEPPPTPVIRALVRAGEQAGKLPEILGQLALDLKEEYQFRRKIRATLAYPSFLFLIVLAVVYTLSFMVLPVYEQIFQNLDTALPILTEVIFKTARWVPLVLFLLMLVFSVVPLLFRFRYPNDWKERILGLTERMPAVGPLYQQSDQVQFFRTVGTLMEAGIPLIECLNLARETVRLPGMKGQIQQLILAMREGKRLSHVIQSKALFSPEVSILWAIGEETGQLSTILHQLALMLRYELESTMDRLNRVLGPILVIVMAGIIGAVALGVMLPIFDVGTKIE